VEVSATAFFSNSRILSPVRMRVDLVLDKDGSLVCFTGIMLLGNSSG